MSAPAEQKTAPPAKTPDQKGITAVVIDQLELLASGVAEVLSDCDVHSVAISHRGGDGLRALRENAATVLIVGNTTDLKPDRILREAKKQTHMPKVMLLLDRAEKADVARLLSMGVDGMILRSATKRELASAIDAMLAGERVIAPAIAAGTIGRVGPKTGSVVESAATEFRLTPKELEVLAELALGSTYKEIASALIVTEATVKTHLVHLYEKLEVRNRQEAVARALSLGLLG